MPIKNNSNVLLPTTTLTASITASQFNAPDNLITHGTNFANWTLAGAGTIKDSTGITLVQTGTESASISISGLSPNTVYWAAIKIIAKSAGASGTVTVSMVGGNIGTPETLADFNVPTLTVGYYKYFKLQTDSSGGPWNLVLTHSSSPNGESFKISDFRLFSIPARSAAKVAILGDRAGSYDAARATATNNALIAAEADTVNIVAVGDQADTVNSHSSINSGIQTTVRARGGDLYSTMGNHDYDASREGEWFTFYSQIAALNGGKRYYRKVLGEMEFFVMDTCAPADNSGGPAPADNAGGRAAASAAAFEASVQGVWLQAALADSTSKWKIVIIHHPAYTSSSTGPFASCRLSFADWGAHLVLQSHDHGAERILHTDGIYYYTCAMGGGNHHGWVASPLPTTEFRLDSNYLAAFATTAGYLKIHDSPTDLVLEYFDTSHQMYDRARIRQV